MKQLLYATAIVAAATALPLSGAVAAGDKKQNPAATETKGGEMKQGQTQGGAMQNDAQKFSKSEYGQLDGRTVKNQGGQEIGEIENIVASVKDKTP